MGKSLVADRAPGTVCKPQTTTQPESGVKAEIKDVECYEKYGMIVTGFSIAESANCAVSATIGDNVFVYCTGNAPVNISLEGIVGYSSSGGPQKGSFPKFYSEHCVSNGGKTITLIIDGATYKGIFTGYSRKRSSGNNELDICSIQIYAVRQDG